MAQASVPSIEPVRRRRIERELHALHAMQSHLNTGDIVLSVIAIPALALLCFLVDTKLHIAFGDIWISVLAAIACGGSVWLIGRRWFGLALLIVIGCWLSCSRSSRTSGQTAASRPQDRAQTQARTGDRQAGGPPALDESPVRRRTNRAILTGRDTP